MVLIQLWVDYGIKDPGLTEILQLGDQLRENQLWLPAMQFTVHLLLIVSIHGMVLLVIG